MEGKIVRQEGQQGETEKSSESFVYLFKNKTSPRWHYVHSQACFLILNETKISSPVLLQ